MTEGQPKTVFIPSLHEGVVGEFVASTLVRGDDPSNISFELIGDEPYIDHLTEAKRIKAALSRKDRVFVTEDDCIIFVLTNSRTVTRELSRKASGMKQNQNG